MPTTHSCRSRAAGADRPVCGALPVRIPQSRGAPGASSSAFPTHLDAAPLPPAPRGARTGGSPGIPSNLKGSAAREPAPARPAGAPGGRVEGCQGPASHPRPPALTGSGAVASRRRSARPGTAAASRESRPRAAEEAVAAPLSRETCGAGRGAPGTPLPGSGREARNLHPRENTAANERN